MLQLYYPISALLSLIVCYERLKTIEIFKLLALKVVAGAYEGLSLTRGSNYRDLS